MKQKGFCYRCAFWLNYHLIDLPANFLWSASLWKCPSETICGIRVIDLALNSRSRFTRLTKEALGLIADSHPFSFKRVQKQIGTICNAAGVVGSVYAVALKTSTVNLRAIDSIADRESARTYLASLLVYDATFGLLLRRGILRNRRNRNRFDHVCRRAAQRFVRRLGVSENPWDEKNMIRLGTHEQTLVLLTDTIAAQRETRKDL